MALFGQGIKKFLISLVNIEQNLSITVQKVVTQYLGLEPVIMDNDTTLILPSFLIHGSHAMRIIISIFLPLTFKRQCTRKLSNNKQHCSTTGATRFFYSIVCIFSACLWILVSESLISCYYFPEVFTFGYFSSLTRSILLHRGSWGPIESSCGQTRTRR